jgi:nucleoside-diphosphate-sugar epimerase
VRRPGRLPGDRPFTVVGEGQRPDMALSRWAAAAREGRPLTLYGSPARTRDITDVRDTAHALRLLAERNIDGPVNIGTGHAHTLADLAAYVAAAAAGHSAAAAAGRSTAPVVVVPAPRCDPPHTLADTRRARDLLGFVPRTDVTDAIRRAFDSPAAA